jgi:Mg-chelatase subunit ChlD
LWPGGATPLWRAAVAGMDSLQAETGRRVVLVLTDGADSGGDYNCAPLVSDPRGAIGSCPTLRDVHKRAETDGFMYYFIGIEGSGVDRGARDLADATGGGYFDLGRNADLAATFARVAEELRHQYLLGFVPDALDGRLHTVSIRVRGQGLTARGRKTYMAEPDR